MKVLGINAYHGDAAAALVIDGRLVAAAEEERFRRLKHWAGMPSEAIRWCLSSQELDINDVDVIAINQDSGVNFFPKLRYALSRPFSLQFIRSKIATRSKRVSIISEIESQLSVESLNCRLFEVEHHRAHLASAFYPSPFNSAWAVSVDGFGDFASGAWGYCEATKVEVDQRVLFPHSLGAFYQAFTQYLGFPNYGDEYKVMGLAPYGKPTYLKALRDVVLLQTDGGYRLNLDYFKHHKENVMFEWSDGVPQIGPMFSEKMIEVFGPVRNADQELAQHHFDLAHSVQKMYEEAFFHLLNALYKNRPDENLAIAGGCAMNSVANGKIRRRTPFKNIYVQAAAGDAGGAVGSALAAWHELHPAGARHRSRNAYLGPAFSAEDIDEVLRVHPGGLDEFKIDRYTDEMELCTSVATAISTGAVVGWFHGAMEWGPRALGHRSILCDPRRGDMKDILNIKIKRRESFRPFAPSVLREKVDEWFEEDDDVPFMMKVFQIRKEKRPQIPAVTHVDGSGRLQTVTETENERYYRLIHSFYSLTGVPMLLNTSFNENEPIVCKPEEALDCFLRTKMDVLVMENTVLTRR